MIQTSAKWHILSLLLGVMMMLSFSACSSAVIGKANLVDDNPPQFLKIGESTIEDVLNTLGEPLGYRERDNLSAMIYIEFKSKFAFLYYGSINIEKAHRLDLVFEDKILKKVELKKEGWGFGANVNPLLVQLLMNVRK